MSADKGGIYQRGGFWLDYVRGAGRRPASNRFYIWWYDPTNGRLQRKSTGTADVRIACDALDKHYLATHKPTEADQSSYTVPEAMTDYWVEHGSSRSSADSIKARLKLMTAFINHEANAGRLIDPFLPDHIDDNFLNRFREWAAAVPIVARRKDESGEWVDGKSRLRKVSTIEESIIQLKAAVKHAYDSRRIRYLPPMKHKTRREVTPVRSDRLSLQGIGELLNYCMTGGGRYTTPERMIPLRRFIIAAICTIARPDAILDISVAPARGQWMPEAGLLALNPAGRLQTNKRRPVLPVVPLFARWLDQTDEWFVCKEGAVFDEKQQIDIITQTKVASVRTAWDGARAALRMPEGRGTKYLRHSMATILANRGVPTEEISLALGHRVLDPMTEIYVIHDPNYLKGFRQGVEDVLADLLKVAGVPLHAKLAQMDDNVHVLRA